MVKQLTFNDFGNCNSSICLSLVRLLMIVARHRSCMDINSLFMTPKDISVFAAVLHIIGYRGSVTSWRPVNAIPRLYKINETCINCLIPKFYLNLIWNDIFKRHRRLTIQSLWNTLRYQQFRQNKCQCEPTYEEIPMKRCV